MTLTTRKIQFIAGLGICLATCWLSPLAYGQTRDTTKKESPYRPSFRLRDRYGDPFSNFTSSSPLFLKDPKALTTDLQLDTGMHYTIYEKMGKVNYRPSSSISFQEFSRQQDRLQIKNYWQTRSKALDGESAVSGRGLIPKIYISPILDRIFGGSYVELIPRGNVILDFGASFQKIENPSIPIRQQRNGGFEFDQQINLSVTGKVGEKLKVTTNFDNNNSFDFQNQMKVEYSGFKEDILKKLEIGNVSLPLNNSLITGSQNLFGIKAQMQFGKLFVTTIATTQRGKQSSLKVNGSTNGTSQGRPFEIVGSSYDENRHFFLAQFFRDNFEKWMGSIPQINSGVNITRIEVYVLNRQSDTQTQRNIVGLMDLGETDKIYNKNINQAALDGAPAANEVNSLYDQIKKGILANIDGTSQNVVAELEGSSFRLVNGTDFEKITSARKLAPTEYTLNKELGYITLQRKLLNDEVLAVAYQYTYNGRPYKVGELSEDYSDRDESKVAYLKLLRPRKISIKDVTGKIIPTWNLMMKNIYNLNVTQLTRDGFQLRVIYRDDRTGIDNPQLQEGLVARTKQLIQVMGLDRLNPYNDPVPDGNFDFVDRVTVNTETGLIIFPFLEPLNKPLRNVFADDPNKDFLINKYVYDTLYRTTKAEAELVATKNKFYIVGSFKAGSGKDIIIQGFNISQGSVKVFAGGTPLIEGKDYTVDYTFGKVTILNEGVLSSGKDIDITYEQQDPFSFQTRSLLGTRLDYKLNDDINIGSTLLYYNERALITRNLIGTEPARNLQYGLDVNIRKNSRILTKMVDALPFLQTKEQSTVTLNAEFAQLLPGTSNIVGGEGTSFIDDFETTATPYSLISPAAWKLSTVPKNVNNLFDLAGGSTNDVRAGYKRAKLAWYQIDNLFYRETSRFKPDNISKDDMKNHYIRRVIPQEIFKYRDPYQGLFNEPIFDVAFYPSERGPFNYNPDLNSDGSLKNPASNWGGITTAIRTEVDFDKANVEYVEFWLLDPFLNLPSGNGNIIDGRGFNQPNTTGGKMVFQLGSISEDLMRDGKHAFENGLPRDGNLTPDRVTENNWGFVTNQQYINNAFDNDPGSRPNQDVGLDGVGDIKEREKFKSDFLDKILDPQAKAAASEDPSADNFRYFLNDEYDAKKAKLLERYKNINGQENNSPVLTGSEPFAQSGTTIPENEDLNQDNTLSDLEEYYSYDIDLRPGKLEVGQKFIVDKITPDPAAFDGEAVTWYLFRIPVRQFDEKVGDINGFKSIRYVRMFLTGFSQPVVLRMANFRTVGNRWRRYTAALERDNFSEEIENSLDNFSVSTVNVEENGVGNNIKPAYVEPLRRDRDNTSTIQRRLNEQSVQLCVNQLQDGDARAIYKNVSFDFFNYGRIKMFISAHSNSTKKINDDQLTGFLRIGTDFDQNYYEIELPLKITQPGENGRRASDIWPDLNQIDLDLNELYALKAQRDRESYPLSSLYPQAAPKAIGHQGIRILGRPDLSQVKLMMIGIRNPKSNDAAAYDVCLWADELRLTDFDRTAGWATNVVLNTKLADLGTVTGSLRHISFGYGNVQSKISERARGETTSYDVSANLNVDKLLPKWTGLKIPMFVSYESTIINPNFDPANPDMRIEAAFKSFNTDAEKSAYRKLIQDRSMRRSLNFTNVRKVKVRKDAKAHLWDIENFAFTYAFSEATQTNFNLLENTRQNVKGAVAWQYNSKFKGFEPFKEVKLFSHKNLQLLKDFTFNPMPTTISVRGDLDRSFTKLMYRNSVKDAVSSQANFQKFFVFNRTYNVRWNLTKTITIDYSSRVNAIIDEPTGDIDTPEKRDSIINNLKKFGRMKNFDQTLTVNYAVPFDKIPLLNWLNTEYRQNAGYNWKAGPLEKDPKLQLGNIIQNTRDRTLTGRIDMVKLYNKIGFLKNINTPQKPPPVDKTKTNRPDTVKRPPDLKAVKSFMRWVMSVRNISGTYQLTDGTILPGFTETPYLFGMNKTWATPGWGFILGQQDPFIQEKTAAGGWLTRNPTLTTPFTQSQTKDIGLRASVEPSSDFKIQLDVKKTTSAAFQEIYRYNPDSLKYLSLSPSRSGSYKISIVSIRTAFKNNQSINSTVFQKFKENIQTVSDRFLSSTGNTYEKKSQDVLIPAFLAAYTGQSADRVGLSPFPAIPIPNWRVDYSGLNKIEALKDIFQTVSLNHAYTSTYSVVNYTNSLEYDNVGNLNLQQQVEDYSKYGYADPINGKIVPLYVISQVMISESFAPLFGFNLRTKSKLSLKFDYKTKRDLSLNISNAQITELNSKDWSLELGFTKNNMKLPFKDQGRVITLKNDITFRLNMSVTNNRTIQRKIDEENTITNGNINFQLRPNITYIVNQKLNVQAYVERNVNEPLVTNSYRRATTRGGVKIVFNLAQ